MQTNIHPRITTADNIATFRRQIKMLGLSYDWSREVDTTDPGYYKWTQWIFLKMYGSWYDREMRRARPIGDLSAEFATNGSRRFSSLPAFSADDLDRGDPMLAGLRETRLLARVHL